MRPFAPASQVPVSGPHSSCLQLGLCPAEPACPGSGAWAGADTAQPAHVWAEICTSSARVGEEYPSGWQYHLGDALGSVRQLGDASMNITLARTYEPFGDPLSTVGTGTSTYGFTGEQRDGTGLVYLRARYYGPSFGRFLSRDPWDGDPNRPMSYNLWLYVEDNPVSRSDPSGLCIDDDLDGRCDPWWLRCLMIRNRRSQEVCLQCNRPRPAQLDPGLPDFDPLLGPTNMPILWPASASREDRAFTVLQWLDAYRGHNNWWRAGDGRFDATAMKAWILYYEVAILVPPYISHLRGPLNPVVAVARMLNRDVGGAIRPDRSAATRLAQYTAFYNPMAALDRVFDHRDWELWLTPPLQTYVATISAVGIATHNEPTNFWHEGEMTLNMEERQWRYLYLYYSRRKQEHIFFGTLDQFVYHGVGQ